jgi:hypothetical protein
MTNIDIDSLTIGQARAIAAMVGSAQVPATPTTVDHGLCIVVADRGWVFVGHLSEQGQTFVMTGSRTVNRWGTTKGLEELADKGPLENTKLADATLRRVIPCEAVKFIVSCNVAAWGK